MNAEDDDAADNNMKRGVQGRTNDSFGEFVTTDYSHFSVQVEVKPTLVMLTLMMLLCVIARYFVCCSIQLFTST